MASKIFEVAFRINGALSGQFSSAMAAAQAAMNRLGQAAGQVNAAMARSSGALNGYLQRLNAIGANSAKFTQLKSSIAQNEQALQAEINKTRQLSQEYQRQKQTMQSLKAALDQLKTAHNAAKNTYTSEQSALKGLKNSLKDLRTQYQAVKSAQGSSSAAAQSLKSQITALSSAIDAQKAKVQSAKSAYDTLKASLKSANAEFKSVDAATKTSGASFEQAKSKVQSLYATLKQQKAELESLKASLNSAGFSTDHFIQSEMKLRQEIEATNRAIERQTQIASQLSAAQGRVNDASSNFADAQSAYNTVTSTVQSIASPFVNATEKAMTFEHAMSRVKALTQSQNIREGNFDTVNAEMKQLTQQALKLGRTSKFSAIEAAQAMGYLGMAGWKTTQIWDTMPGMLNLAAAADADLAQTSDIVSDNMTAMGVPVEQAAHFMDVYAYALTNSNARLSDFGETMKYAAPVAKAYGSSLDETAAMVMMMANAGIKGSMAGTSLRMGLLRLAGPPKTATKAMEELGLSLSDAQAGALEAEAVIKGLGIDLSGAVTPGEKMTRVLMQLHEKTKDLSQDEKLAAFKGIFGVNAETGWLALFDQGPDVFLKYVEGLRNADGYSAQVAATMIDDTEGAVIAMQSALEGANIAVGQAITPAVRSVVEAITPLISAFAQWATVNPEIIQGIVGIIAAASGLAVAITGVSLAFAGWEFITAQLALFRAGMLTTEVAGLGMAARMGSAFVVMRASIVSAFASMRAITWGSLFTGLTAQITAAGVAVRSFFASIVSGSAISAAAAGIRNLGTAFLAAGRAALAFAFSPVGVALMALAALAYVVYQNWDRLGPVFHNLGNIITSSIGNAISAIGPAISSVTESIGRIFEALNSTGAGDTLLRVFIMIATTAATVAATIIEVFAQAVKTVADLFKNLGDVISHILEGEFVEAVKSAANIVVDGFNDAIDTIKASGKIFELGQNVQNSLDAYKAAASMPTQEVTARHAVPVDQKQSPQSSEPVAPVTPTETPQLDTTQAQSQIDELGQAAQQPAQSLTQMSTGAEQSAQAFQQMPQSLQTTQEALAQFPQALQPVQEALSQFPQSLEPVKQALTDFPTSLEPTKTALQGIADAGTPAKDAVQQLGDAAASAHPNIQTLGDNAGNAAPNVQELGDSAGGAAGNVQTLGTNAGDAAGNVGRLSGAADAVAGALETAASKIANINITVPTITVGAPAAAANYAGGIYNKGAFLTWFAEKSPEAAIPLDKSARAINLWTQAGQMLGVLPSDGTSNIPIEKPSKDATQRGIENLRYVKEKRANQIYNSIVNQQSTENSSTSTLIKSSVANALSTIAQISTVQKSVQNLQEAQFDELGNIIGLNGAAGNVITKYDDDKIKHVKQELQFKEFTQKQSSTVTNNQNVFSQVIEKVREAFTSVKNISSSEKTADTIYSGERQVLTPIILTEQQRYIENTQKQKTLDRIKESRSYKAIQNAVTRTDKTSTSMLNLPAELNTKIATDSTGGIIGQIFGTDFGLGQIATQRRNSNTPTTSTGKLPDWAMTTGASTMPQISPELNTKIPTDSTGGIIGQIFGTDFGLGQIATLPNLAGDLKNSAGIQIMQPTPTFPTIAQANSPALLERINAVQNTEPLEKVTPSNFSSSDYSASSFNPTFNITVTVNGNGENIDTKAVGEKIAFSARESFEKEFEKFKREQSRRAFS